MVRHARDDYLVNVDNKKLQLFRRGGRTEDFDELDATERERLQNTVAYKHIFGERRPDRPSENALQALGEALMARARGPSADSEIPAGYTYLGQFIFHDITAMIPGRIDPRDWKNGRTPSLDLDSVLPSPGDTPGLRAPDGLFKIGTTTGDVRLPEDLPRVPEDAPGEGRPLIHDERNDDFLPLAQCHLLLLKFYNAIARYRGYDGGTRDEDWWQETKRLWVQHFQSVALHDYLPRIIDTDTYRDVIDKGRCIVRTDKNERDWFPLEFAGAVGRFGHSMIRDAYKPWNRRQAGRNVDVDHFMEFSYLNSRDGLEWHDRGVPGIWATNWFSLFDFRDAGYEGPLAAPIMSARIDTNLAPKLFNLPACLLEDSCSDSGQEKFNLASTTLLRGRELGLATAQYALGVADTLLGGPLPRLTYNELFSAGDGLNSDLKGELAEATPLWYYVLKEAECQRFGKGMRLGPLGGRIVMETMHAAITASKDSILAKPGWQTSLPSASVSKFTMLDLILFSAEPNPLDNRI
jgi:Animal haem peroxidase